MDAEQFAALLSVGPQPTTTLPPVLLAEVGGTRALITQAYLEAWGRPPRPEEWLAIADFVSVGEDDEAPPADPEAADRAQLDYEEAAGEGVGDLWENHFSTFMDPFRFRETLITGHLGPTVPEDAAQLLTEIRQRITQQYLITWQREPAEADWRAFCQAAKLTFTLPDGTELPRKHFLRRTLELCYTCGDALTVGESITWVMDGFAHESRPALSLDQADYERRQAELVKELTAGRNHPPTKEDWQTLAQLVADFVNDNRNDPTE